MEEGLSEENELIFIHPREFQAVPKPKKPEKKVENKSLLYKLIPEGAQKERHKHKTTVYYAYIDFCNKHSKKFTCQSFIEYLDGIIFRFHKLI